MVEQRQSAMQRIQVGLIGLVVVLLFVSLANMVLDRVTGGQDTAATPDSSPPATTDEDGPARRAAGRTWRDSRCKRRFRGERRLKSQRRIFAAFRRTAQPQ